MIPESPYRLDNATLSNLISSGAKGAAGLIRAKGKIESAMTNRASALRPIAEKRAAERKEQRETAETESFYKERESKQEAFRIAGEKRFETATPADAWKSSPAMMQAGSQLLPGQVGASMSTAQRNKLTGTQRRATSPEQPKRQQQSRRIIRSQ